MPRAPRTIVASLLALSLAGACGGGDNPKNPNADPITGSQDDRTDKTGSQPGGNQPQSNYGGQGTGTGSGRGSETP